MRRLILEPDGWPCSIRECPPGFFLHGDSLCFKTEYRQFEAVGSTNVPGPEIRWAMGNNSDVYCSSGESFWGGVTDKEERENIEVQPVIAKWEEYDE